MATPATTVVNLKGMKDYYGHSLEKSEAANVIYVGRNFNMGGWRLKESPFRNPFKATATAGADKVIHKEYRLHISNLLEENPDLKELLMSYRGKALACWCSPGNCHADVLREIIDGYRPGDVVCGRKPGRGQGAYPIVRSQNGSEYVNVPAYSRGAGNWKTLSPFFLRPEPFYEITAYGTKVKQSPTCIENLWQATKVEAELSRESENKPPKDEWWTRRNKVWSDPTPHRHVLAKADRIHPSMGRHYWNGKYISYEEARKKIYIPFYWEAAEKQPAFRELVDMYERGVNFQIIGPDGREIDSELGLYGELQILTKPFGHELVLVAMVLNQRVHEWYEKDGVVYEKDGYRAIELVWPRP